jgi:hypothetical protein
VLSKAESSAAAAMSKMLDEQTSKDMEIDESQLTAVC